MPRAPSAGFIEEKNKAEVASINLYTFKYDPGSIGTWEYLAEHDINVSFGGITYVKSSIRREDIESKKEGAIATTSIVVPDLTGSIWGSVLNNSATLKKMTINIKMAWLDRLDDASAYIEDEFEVDSAETNELNVVFSLKNPLIFDDFMPRFMYMHNKCRYIIFKLSEGGTRCKYVGVETECDRSWRRCNELDNLPNFGGFPQIKKKWY